MKREILLTLLLTTTLFMATGFSQAQRLRIMSYNIRNAKGMDNKIDYSRVAKIISAVHPDIVAVQELDSATARSGNTDVLKEVANQCGYHYYFGPAISYDGGKYGVGVLTKEKPLNVTNVPLPGKEEKRNLEMVEFKDFYFFTVHLSLTEADRNTSIEIINEQVSKIKKPVFLAGDFNAEPSSAAILNLKKTNWQLLSGEDYTFPSTKPDRCIDYIFAGNGKKWRIINAEVFNDDIASDHRPVWVELEQ